MDNKIFKTDLINLKALENLFFSIPSYQRPYVWEQIHIESLLTDLWDSFEKDEVYYLGTILTKEDQISVELIDGQQRFTTLWLTAFVFNQKSSISETLLKNILKTEDNKIKINFEIRTEVEEYLNRLVNPNQYIDKQELKSTEHPYLKNISEALVTIENFINEKETTGKLKDFGDYIYEKVFFIKNKTPNNLDLNKLFSTINSAGVQLEQTDIVKANLLKQIDEKVLYSKIWEACENMNSFFEQNVKSSFPHSDWRNINFEYNIPFSEDIFIFEREDQLNYQDEFSIDSLHDIHIEYTTNEIQNEEDENNPGEIYCRSIINFGQLLLHTYRIYLYRQGKKDFEGTFHVNRLIEVFSNLTDPDEIKDFLKLLWEVRHVFDKYIIKWISDSNTKTERIELVNIHKDHEGYYSRTPYESKTSSLMLQSVLYFTGDYLRQYWLSPLLYKLLQNTEANYKANDIKVLDILENIDNQLSICTRLTDKEATFKLLTGNSLTPDFDFVDYLMNHSLGTGFRRYWFQKLEYILWKNWEEEKTEAYNNYRIVNRNSIEHVYPQNNSIIGDEFLHSFGNLVLTSVHQNSEYSDNEVFIKKRMFEKKLRNSTYDTLKSYYIFKYTNWENKDEIENNIEAHKNEMLDKLKEHYDI